MSNGFFFNHSLISDLNQFYLNLSQGFFSVSPNTIVILFVWIMQSNLMKKQSVFWSPIKKTSVKCLSVKFSLIIENVFNCRQFMFAKYCILCLASTANCKALHNIGMLTYFLIRTYRIYNI